MFQFASRSAGFFTTVVNPIGLHNISWRWMITYCVWLAFEIVFIVDLPYHSTLCTGLTDISQYFMFPETYGRTLEELAFLFEDRALADEATAKVEKQMEWSAERRWSHLDERLSWDMDVIVPGKRDERRSDDSKVGNGVVREMREEEHVGGNRQVIRGERGGWWDG